MGARTTTTGGKGGTLRPRGGQRHWNGPQLLPPARMIHGAAPRPGMGTDQSTGHLPLTLAADHWEREGKRRLPGRWQGLANHQGSPDAGRMRSARQCCPLVAKGGADSLAPPALTPVISVQSRWRHLETLCPCFTYIKNTQVGTGFSGEEGGIPPLAASVTTVVLQGGPFLSEPLWAAVRVAGRVYREWSRETPLPSTLT